jgi:hypothetical protein
VSADQADAAMPSDGHVKFGPRPTQEVPAAWASSMLTWLHANHPQVFGAALQQAAGIEPPVKAPRKPRGGQT